MWEVLLLLHSRKWEEMDDDGNTWAIVFDGLLQRWPCIAAVRAHGVEERLHQYRLAPRRQLPAVHKPIHPSRDGDLREAAAARPAYSNYQLQ